MSKPRKNIRWSEMPQFMPMNKSYYEKLKSFSHPVAESPTKALLNSANGIVPNRQRLLHLIKCLAISETQRKQLSSHLEEITRQKLDLDTKLLQKEKEKNDILNNEKSIDFIYTDAKTILEEKCCTLEEKEKEIALLHKKLSELQKTIDPKIPTIPAEVCSVPIAQHQTLQPVEPSTIAPPVSTEAFESPMRALEDKLTLIQNEINTLTAKITMVASQTPKEVIREIIREPTAVPNQTKDRSYFAHAISISGDDSSLSSGQLKSIEEIPNLATLLKKIIKSRKVHYPEPILKPEVAPNLKEKKRDKSRTSSISRHIERLEAELNEKKQLLNLEANVKPGPKNRDQPAETRNAATSPPNESYLFPRDSTNARFNSGSSLHRSFSASESVPIRAKHRHRKENDIYKSEKSKPGTKPEYFPCECSTCSENVSWVCPGCVSEESSLRQPGYKMFDDDTSMIKPLAEIVSDLENERTIDLLKFRDNDAVVCCCGSFITCRWGIARSYFLLEWIVNIFEGQVSSDIPKQGKCHNFLSDKYIIMREESAYFTPSAIIIGLGLHDLASSLYLLASKFHSSSTLIWKVAFLVWFIVFGFVLSQLIILDYVAVPYQTPDFVKGLLQILNYTFDFAVGLGVGVILLMRIQIVYGMKSKLFVSMMFMFLAMVFFKGVGNYYGFIVGVNVMDNPNLEYYNDPLYSNSPRYLAIGQIFEAIFYSTGSVGFLYSLGKAVGNSSKNILFTILLKYEGLSLITIIILNLIIASFGIHISVYGFTYVNHIALYLPSWTYCLEFYTFLKHSYVDARTIIEERIHFTEEKIEFPKKATISNS